MQDVVKAKPRWISGIEPSPELLACNGTQILEIECREQPVRLRDLVRSYQEDSEIRAELQALSKLSKNSGPILFIGMGGSYCSSISASTLLQSSGRLSFSVDA